MSTDDLISRAARRGLLDEAATRARLGARPVSARILVEMGILAPQQIEEIAPIPESVRRADRDPENRFGRYVRVRELGRGGFGSVWEAWDRELARPVAMKFLHGHSQEDLARFKREARAAGKLSHPGIVTVFDVGEARGEPFIVMELVPGKPSDEAGLDARRAADAIRQAAEAVHHAHERGVIHRDLKPQNILITGDAAKVMDFGLAKTLSGEQSLSITGDVMGTPSFMAPEQALGKIRELGPRTDVYGLGATLYALATGRPPFGTEAGEVFQTLSQVVHEEPPVPAGVDRDLRTIMLKCLEKDPARRYGTALELAEDLRRYGAGEPVLARPASVLYRFQKLVARNPVAWGLGLVLSAAVALGVPAWLAWRFVEARRLGEEGIAALEHDDPGGAAARLERSVELWSMARYREALARAREGEKQAAFWDTIWRRTGTFHTSFERVAATLAELEDSRGTDDLTEDQRNQRLQRIDEALAGVNDPLIVEAIRGWARLMADREQEGMALIDRCAEAGDPFGALVHARIHIRELIEEVLIDVKFGGPTGIEVQEVSLSKRWDGVLKNVESDVAPFRTWDRWSRSVEEGRYVSLIHGLHLLKEHRFAEAARELARVAGEPGVEHEALFLESVAWLHAGEFVMGEARLAHLSLQRPRWNRVWNWLGVARTAIGRQALRRGEAREAEWRLQSATLAYDRSLEREPENVYARFLRGLSAISMAEALAETGQDPSNVIRTALKDFDRAIAADPDASEALSGRGHAGTILAREQSQRGIDPVETLKRAVDDYARAAELNPDSSNAAHCLAFGLNRLGQALRDRGEDPRPVLLRGIAEADRAIEARADDPYYFNNRGNLYADLAEAMDRWGGDIAATLRRAIEDFDRSASMAPTYSDSFNGRGRAWMKLGDLSFLEDRDPRPEVKAAIADLSEAVRLEPGNIRALNNLGNAYRSLGTAMETRDEDPRPEYREAIHTYDRVLTLNPKYWAARMNRGATNRRLASVERERGGDPKPLVESAISDFDAVLAQNPKSWQAFANRGLLYEDLARLSEAAADYEAALKINPGYPQLVQLLEAVKRRMAGTQDE